jgi:solute carrier family 25 oxoglutarate transporter 11
MSSTSKTMEPFVVGGTSAMFASSCVHPIDLAKVRLQLYTTLNPGKRKPGFAKMLKEMVRTEGITSIYAGLSAALMRQACYGTARIGLHRKFSEELTQRNEGKPLSFGLKVISGMASGSIAVVIGTPFDVCLVRMQADSMKSEANKRGYKNVFDALYTVARDEGFSKLYSGLAPNILRGMSINVGMLACYDQAKELITKHVTKETPDMPVSLQTQILSSLIAGFTASAFSLPFDLIKSRLQDGGKYTGIVDCASQIFRKEGFFAFWTGLDAYYMRTAPHAMIILLTAEPITKLYKKATTPEKYA